MDADQTLFQPPRRRQPADRRCGPFHNDSAEKLTRISAPTAEKPYMCVSSAGCNEMALLAGIQQTRSAVSHFTMSMSTNAGHSKGINSVVQSARRIKGDSA